MSSRSTLLLQGGYFSQAALASAATPSEFFIPVITQEPSTNIHAVTFFLLILSTILISLPFLHFLARTCGSKQEAPPGTPTTKYATGKLFHLLAFTTVTLWFTQLIMHTIYVQRVYMLSPPGHFSRAGRIARYAIDHLTDFFVAASYLRLLSYRLPMHVNSTTGVAPISSFKKTLSACLLFVHLVSIVCTTIFFAINQINPPDERRELKWLLSLAIHTEVYLASSHNVILTLIRFRKMSIAKSIVDEPMKSTALIPMSISIHTYFKVIALIMFYSRNGRIGPIDFDVFRLLDVVVGGLTYFNVMFNLATVGGLNEEDGKKMEVLKEEIENGKRVLGMLGRLERHEVMALLEAQEQFLAMKGKADTQEKQEVLEPERPLIVL